MAPPVSIHGATSRFLPSWEDLSDIPSEDAALASCKPTFWRHFPLALCVTPATFGARVLERLPPPKEARQRFFPLLCMLRDAVPICAVLSSTSAVAELP